MGGRRARVAIQDSCHLRNGLRVFAEPRALISAVAEFVAVPGDDSCCGSAGTYSLLRPRDSRRILGPKLDAFEAAGVDYVVAVNPGCLRQLQTACAAGEAPSAPCTSPTCSSPRPAAARCPEDGGGSFREARGGDRARRARRRAGRPELPILVINASGVDPGERSTRWAC